MQGLTEVKKSIPNSVVLILLFVLSALLIGQFSSLMHEIFAFLILFHGGWNKELLFKGVNQPDVVFEV